MNRYILNTAYILSLSSALILLPGCEREIDTSVPATSPKVAEVFIDGFASGVDYQAWGKPTNLSQDTETKYSGTTSLKVEVPVPSDPLGNFAGGTFFAEAGRDLSGYDALTFYAKSSTPTTIVTGIGNYGDNPEYMVTLSDISLNDNWTKVIVPIPNPAKLTEEKGLFFYSAGAVDDQGYSIWIDDVKFEKLGTLAHPRIESSTMAGFPTGNIEINDLTAYVNLPDGIDQEMTISSRYFTFNSSNPEVATVEENVITFHGAKGSAVLTPQEAEAGTITITGVYDFAPEPDKDESEVISLYCDNYTNTLSSPFNGYWAPHQTTTNDEIVLSENHHIMHYGSFNFVGIVLNEDANCTGKTYAHMDILLQDQVDNAQINVSADLNEAGDHAGNLTVSLKTGEWVSIDIPLNGASSIHQFQLAKTDGSPTYQNILIDNIYFY